MSKILSFEELQKWEYAEEDFGGLINEGLGRTRVVRNVSTKGNNSIYNKKSEIIVKKEEKINNLH